MALLGQLMADFMLSSVNLRPAGRKLPSLGVYRSVNGIFLSASWIDLQFWGVHKVPMFFCIQPYIPMVSFVVRCARLNTLILYFTICFTILSQVVTTTVNEYSELEFLTCLADQGCYIFAFIFPIECSQPDT